MNWSFCRSMREALKLATKSGCPIIPIAMNNTAEIFEAHFPRITKTKVVLEYGAPIYPDQLPKEDQKETGTVCTETDSGNDEEKPETYFRSIKEKLFSAKSPWIRF